MKKVVLFIFVFIFLFYFSSCSATNQPVENPSPENIATASPVSGNSPKPDSGAAISDSGTSATITNLNKSYFIGCWNDTPYWAAGRGDNHNFYSDGSYRFGFNEMDGLRRQLYMDGTWELIDNKIKVSIKSQTILVGGKIVYNQSLGHYIEGGKREIEKIDPPLVREYEIIDLHYDNNINDIHFDQNKQGTILTAHFWDTQFWKLDDNPAPQ